MCQYKNALGIPGKGIHRFRIFGLALFDIIATIAVAILMFKFLHINFWIALFGLFLLGTLLHWLFCVETALLKRMKLV